MARNAKYYNSDNSPVLACTHGRYSHAFKSEWFQHPPCTAEQAEWLIHSYRRRGFEVKKALSLDYRHWIISVRLPYSERPPRASRTFQQRMRVLLRPVLVPELGLVVLKPGRESIQIFHNPRVLVEPEPKSMRNLPSGVVPAVRQPLAEDKTLLPFFSNERVIRAAGGVGALSDWLLRHVTSCQWPNGDYHHTETVIHRYGTGAMVLCWHCDNQLRDQTSESLELLAQQNLTAWVIDVIRHAISGTQERELSLAELSWWAVCNQVVDALPEAVSRRSLGLPAEKICSVYRESDIVPGEQTATSILKQRTKNLAPLPYAHQQQKSPQEKTVVSITVDPESPESFMKLPKRRRWVKEKYTRWVKTQPCACCGMPADDPHHLIGHGQGGMGTKAHDLFVLPLCRKHHNELHTDTVAFEDKYGSQLELIFRFIDRALAIGVLA